MTTQTTIKASSYNPFNYTPAQLAKAGMAFLTALGAILGLLVTTFATGPFAVVGLWAAGILMALNPVLVFIKSAAPIIAVLGNPFGTGRTD